MRQSLEVGDEYLVGVIKELRNDSDVTDHGHIVRVASPTRHDVHMDMCSDTSTGSGAEIQADIETVWLQGAL